MQSTILFPASHYFDAEFIVVPKRMCSSSIYEGYHALVTYPITFFTEREIAGYLLLLFYRDAEDRRSCHFSSIQLFNMDAADVLKFITSFSEEAEAETVVVETYSPPPGKKKGVFPYSEVLLALPGNANLSEPLKNAGFREIMRIPCFEFMFAGSRLSAHLHPYQGTQEERRFYWEEWVKRPEALSIKDRKLKSSLFIENYLYDFSLFSSPDMVLFGENGFVHWFPDISPYLNSDIRILHSTVSDIKNIERVKLFRVVGENPDDLTEQSMQYISSSYGTKKFQLDNYASKSLVESLEDSRIILDCSLIYERVIFSLQI